VIRRFEGGTPSATGAVATDAIAWCSFEYSLNMTGLALDNLVCAPQDETGQSMVERNGISTRSINDMYREKKKDREGKY